jgi:hypothetical protein
MTGIGIPGCGCGAAGVSSSTGSGASTSGSVASGETASGETSSGETALGETAAGETASGWLTRASGADGVVSVGAASVAGRVTGHRRHRCLLTMAIRRAPPSTNRVPLTNGTCGAMATNPKSMLSEPSRWATAGLKYAATYAPR